MPFKFKKPGLKSALISCCLISATTLGGCATTAVQYNPSNIDVATDNKLRPAAAPLNISDPLSIDQVRTRTLSHNSEYNRAQTQYSHLHYKPISAL